VTAKAPLALLVLTALAGNAPASEDVLSFGRFGSVTMYREAAQPRQVVLFVSGDGGWNLGVVDMARELATTGALVVGIDILRYLKALGAGSDACLYPAADFEALSQFVQKKLDLPRYLVPVLVGYSSGATLVYAILAQAPPNTFAGAVSLGFCPDFPATKPFCKGSGLAWEPRPKGKGVDFLPATHLQEPWIALQGTVDQVCDPAGTEAFVKQVPHGEVVMLPKVGHGFSVPRNWLPQFQDAFERVVGSSPVAAAPTLATAEPSPPGGPVTDVSDLPLVEVPARGEPTDTLAVIVSGDGGWAGIDRDLGGAMADRGVAVVGLNSLQYFWKKKTPEIAGRDLERIVRHYLAAWGKAKVLLVGYSRGAEVVPFMTDRLPPDLRSRVVLLALLGPTPTVEFEFHVGDWVGGGGGKSELPVRPEIEKLAGVRILCFYGDEERDSLCPDLPASFATAVRLKGAHHFGGGYATIAETILRDARSAQP
jgi:type IV secretory pathway VirJ component